MNLCVLEGLFSFSNCLFYLNCIFSEESFLYIKIVLSNNLSVKCVSYSIKGGIIILLSLISSSAISSSAISASAISMVTTPGLPQYGASVVIGLISLLSLKEVFSASEKWNSSLNSSLNLAILPLLIVFVAIIIYKIVAIV